MNPAAVLGVIGSLYEQVDALTRENEQLRAALTERNATS